MNMPAYFGHLNFHTWIVSFTTSVEASKKPGRRSLSSSSSGEAGLWEKKIFLQVQ